MGRGRQKAKQTKVARELKYASFEPNYEALQRELGKGHSDVSSSTSSRYDSEDKYDKDPYADWSDER